MSDWRDDDDLALLRARRAELALRSADRHPAARASAAASIVGPHTIGTRAMVDVGCSVWARTDGDVSDIRLDHRGEARGGVVVEVTTRRSVDVDTGEVAEQRAFRCADPYACPRLRWSILTEAQVDPQSIEAPELTRRWRVICALLDAARMPGKRLDLLRTEADRSAAICDAWRLARGGQPSPTSSL